MMIGGWLIKSSVVVPLRGHIKIICHKKIYIVCGYYQMSFLVIALRKQKGVELAKVVGMCQSAV